MTSKNVEILRSTEKSVLIRLPATKESQANAFWISKENFDRRGYER